MIRIVPFVFRGESVFVSPINVFGGSGAQANMEREGRPHGSIRTAQVAFYLSALGEAPAISVDREEAAKSESTSATVGSVGAAGVGSILSFA